MNRSRHTRAARPAFTLVELLVVIAIIAILVGLISAAVVKALGVGSQTANMSDLRNISSGVQAFMSRYQLSDPPPSRLILCENYEGYLLPPQTGQARQFRSNLHRDSAAYIRRMFTRINWPEGTSTGIDWNNNGVIDAKENYLEGDQCLVFFLGGIQRVVNGTPDCQGFSTDPSNPARPSIERIGPFFEFKSSRLIPRNGWFVYMDSYNQRPYAYFSTFKGRNGYNRYFGDPTLRPVVLATYSDCQTLGVWPYAEIRPVNNITPAKYLNPDSFQIVSAGANGEFGSGTVLPGWAPLWSLRSPGFGDTQYSGSGRGSDDQSNFHNLLLGVPAE